MSLKIIKTAQEIILSSVVLWCRKLMMRSIDLLCAIQASSRNLQHKSFILRELSADAHEIVQIAPVLIEEAKPLLPLLPRTAMQLVEVNSNSFRVSGHDFVD